MVHTLIYIILSTFLISLISFIGIFVLVLREKTLDKILLIFVSLSAGALIGGAFLHLLPEAIFQSGANSSNILTIFLVVIFGFCLFFVLEQFILWHHCHSATHGHECKVKPFSYLMLFSDGLHNFIDGLVIAASFVISFPTGLAASLAIIIHEIPQEIGDFGVLVYGGFKKSKALFLNFLIGLIAILGGVVGFLLADKMSLSLVYLLPFAAGNFLYIAASDLIPEIKQKESLRISLLHFMFFVIGIIIMYFLRAFLV